MKVIVNADDFGLCRGVNYGIIDAFCEGIVRSASLMPGGTAFDHAVKLAKQNPELGVGVHLTLTYGRPVLTGHKTIVDKEGNFLKRHLLEAGQNEIDQKEVEAEYAAQIEKVIRAGIKPTHLDSHHHVHMLEKYLPFFLRTAKKYGLPVRLRDDEQRRTETAVRCPCRFEENFFGVNATKTYLINVLTSAGEGCQIGKEPQVKEEPDIREDQHPGKKDEVMEIMCHPAYVDKKLCEESSYRMERAEELAVLTSQSVKAAVAAGKIDLINFASL